MRRTLCLEIYLVALLGLTDLSAHAGGAGAEGLREWTDMSGKYTVEAKLLRVTDGKVELQRKSGKVLVVELRRLSKKDKSWIDEWSRDSSGVAPAQQPAAKDKANAEPPIASADGLAESTAISSEAVAGRWEWMPKPGLSCFAEFTDKQKLTVSKIESGQFFFKSGTYKVDTSTNSLVIKYDDGSSGVASFKKGKLRVTAKMSGEFATAPGSPVGPVATIVTSFDYELERAKKESKPKKARR